MRALFTIAALMLPLTTAAAPTALENNRVQEAQDLANAKKGLVPGKPVDCITLFRPKYNTEMIGDAILYRFNNRLAYINETAGGCSPSTQPDVLVVVNTSAQLCRGTLVRTVNPVTGITTGGCTLGSFTPYSRGK
jgi:hypothetical protein